MSESLSTTVSRGNVCPVCKKKTYSRGGIHPQCAVAQADEPRREKLAKQKKLDSAQPKGEKFKKRCPKCGTDVHVRLKVCKCGKAFK